MAAVSADSRVETADSFRQAPERLSYWASQLVIAGRAATHGAKVRRDVWLPGQPNPVFGIYIEPHSA